DAMNTGKLWLACVMFVLAAVPLQAGGDYQILVSFDQLKVMLDEVEDLNDAGRSRGKKPISFKDVLLKISNEKNPEHDTWAQVLGAHNKVIKGMLYKAHFVLNGKSIKDAPVLQFYRQKPEKGATSLQDTAYRIIGFDFFIDPFYDSQEIMKCSEPHSIQSALDQKIEKKNNQPKGCTAEQFIYKLDLREIK
ncbi:hypothetical protein ACFL6Y_10950, partial [Elusimicrobiota bacterium]